MMKNKFIKIILALVLSSNILFASAYSADASAVAGGKSEMSIGKYFDSPAGIATIAAIATTYSYALYNGADKQEKDSKSNVAKIDKILASFKDSYSTFCPNGRNNLAEPKCYCYAADGSQNSSRSNSQTCIDLWAKNAYKLTGDASNYNALAYNPDVAGCVSVDGQFDETCKCKKLVNASGVNACKKESSVSLPADAFSTALATSGGLSDLLKYSANTSNGNPRFDLIGTASLGTNAIKARQITDALMTKVPLSNGQKIPNINSSNVDKYAKAILGEKNIADRANSRSMASNVAALRSDNPAAATLLQQAQAKVGIDVTGSGKGLSETKTKKKGALDLNFGSDNGGNSNGQVIGNFPEEKNYKFKNSDIVTDQTASIFEIISNRYVQSGLKRLFDDEKK